jgi:ABC-2 type transport system ATP-binding protein
LRSRPINGLDPEGIIWIRELLRSLAREGRTVLVSSHLMSEMAITADHLLVIGRGKLIADAAVDDFLARATSPSTRVRAADPHALRAALERDGAAVTVDPDGGLIVERRSSTEIGAAALETATVLSELTPIRASLEEAYLELSAPSTEYTAHVREAAS